MQKMSKIAMKSGIKSQKSIDNYKGRIYTYK